MKYLKYIIPFALVLAIGGGAWYFFRNSFHLERKSVSAIISSLQKTREISRLYTGVYFVPILDAQMGYLKRDTLKEGLLESAKTMIPLYGYYELYKQGKKYLNNEPIIQIDKEKQVIVGICAKKYEVAFGYNNLLSLMQDETVLENACASDLKKLPDPQILAVNCKSTDLMGKYDSTGPCFKWDSMDAERKKIILASLQADGLVQKIRNNAKNSLKNMLLPLCQQRSAK